MRLNETIAAVSSSAGPAARMIVRASGPGIGELLNVLCPGCPPPPIAVVTTLSLDGMRLPVWAYRFAAGRSYTGDELIELHIPGNPLLARMLLERLIALGARAAEPGEFTARAFFNGRMDLSQAEGVAAVVSAANQAELDAGRRLLAGELSRRLRPIMDDLAQTLALIEAEIDFSDQDVRFLSTDQVNVKLNGAIAALDLLLRQSARMARLSHEPRIALAGRPNAGKSTLLNVLSQSARAVVSPVAGTTRDALSAQVILDRGLIWLVDMAGLEESAAGGIESEMRRRALRELEQADLVVLVREAMDERPPLELPREAHLIVRTKTDLHGIPASGEIGVSAVSGMGLGQLRAALDALAFGNAASGAELALTSRHVAAIGEARDALGRVAGLAAELAAAELRAALDSLGQVVGEMTPDDILGRVFSTFCIGK
jgi:tRNA modification GTPase